ncbi:MAG: hypothetical protein GY797_25705 [Deltaproteobacteria bacterium]|nr:hypothetical protein [Deltaproteobacteria bacterium]
MEKHIKITNSFQSLHGYLRYNNFKGYEFDDILGSKVVKLLTFGNLFLERVAIQVGRRSVINLRRVLGVKKLYSSKAFGFFAKGYLYHYLVTQDKTYLNLVKEHLSWLENNFCKEYSGMSWGNSFDFASRGGVIPKGTPTIVWTAHISESFDHAYSVLKQESYKNTVLDAALFIQESLGRNEDETGVCLAYGPNESGGVIHNSNLLGAVALLRAWKYTQNKDCFDLARKAINWSCARINSDGSWYYGDDEKYKWIDNFHTAYNLDSLVAAQDIGGEGLVNQEMIDATYKFWIDNFFLEDGTPKYYCNETYPLDIQCASQAIESLAKYSERDQEAIHLALKVANWTIGHMQKKNGAFRFRKGRIFNNGLESIHWGQSTMLSALGCLLYYLKKLVDKKMSNYSPQSRTRPNGLAGREESKGNLK